MTYFDSNINNKIIKLNHILIWALDPLLKQREFDPSSNLSYVRVDRGKATKVRHFNLTEAHEAYSKRRINLL